MAKSSAPTRSGTFTDSPPRVLVVDDDRAFFCTEHYTKHVDGDRVPVLLHRAYDVATALSLIEAKSWDEVWLDHDMGADPTDTVYPVVEAMQQAVPLMIGKVFVHSGNEQGARNIEKLLEDFYYVVRRDPICFVCEYGDAS